MDHVCKGARSSYVVPGNRLHVKALPCVPASQRSTGSGLLKAKALPLMHGAWQWQPDTDAYWSGVPVKRSEVTGLGFRVLAREGERGADREREIAGKRDRERDGERGGWRGACERARAREKTTP